MQDMLTRALECLIVDNVKAKFAAVAFIDGFLYLFGKDHTSKENLIESSNLVSIVYVQM